MLGGDRLSLRRSPRFAQEAGAGEKARSTTVQPKARAPGFLEIVANGVRGNSFGLTVGRPV